MKHVLHLIDDPKLGGINRTLEMHANGLGKGFSVERRLVDPRGLSVDGLVADVVVVHFTLAWRKLPFW